MYLALCLKPPTTIITPSFSPRIKLAGFIRCSTCFEEDKIKGCRLYDLQKIPHSSNYRHKEILPLCRVEAGAEIAGFICPGSASAARSRGVGVNAIKTVVVFVSTGVFKLCFHCRVHIATGPAKIFPRWKRTCCAVSTWTQHVHTLPHCTTREMHFRCRDFCATYPCFCVFLLPVVPSGLLPTCVSRLAVSFLLFTLLWTDCRHRRSTLGVCAVWSHTHILVWRRV